MVKFQSFKITDSSGINELLSKNLIASGQPVFVSEGYVLIPYEDGEQMNNQQKIVYNMESINKLSQTVDIFMHDVITKENDILVIEKQIADLENEVITPGNKEQYEKSKENKDKIKNLNNVLDQKRNQLLGTKNSITEKISEINTHYQVLDVLKNPEKYNNVEETATKA